MSNTLTNLIPDVYAALDVVPREPVGFIGSVLRDTGVDRVAIGQTVRDPQTRANSAGRNITPAMAFPAANDQTVDNAPVTITKARAYPFSWSGEEKYALNQGPGSLTIRQGWIMQALRSAVNEIENDLAVAASIGGSRAYGTSGTTPFASDIGPSAQLKKILDDNGAPQSGRSAVISTTTGANLRTLYQLTRANEAGTTDTLRMGTLLDLNGFAFRESGQAQVPAVGTGASYLVNNAGGYAKGVTALTVDTGSGTILVGDVITVGNFKYVVAAALAANVVTIAAPGLQEAVADNATVSVNAISTRNVALAREAMILAERLPELPDEGDLALDRETVVDPVSGLAFEIAAYPGYRMVTYELSACWGVKVLRPEYLALLLG